MKTIRPYQFVEFRATGFESYYQAIQAAGGIICLDFEDSIQGTDEAATTQLKQRQRRQVREQLLTAGLDTRQFALRLNSPATPHYAADLRALRGLPELHAVFVPKVERAADLLQVLRELPVAVRHVIAVVETQAGFAALPELLALADPRLDLLAFGHCDYNLSLGQFPFIHQDTETYWQWLATLDAHVQQAGKQLLNSPVLRLADQPLFDAVLDRLRAYPSVVGQITLCLTQTQTCAHARTTTPAWGAAPAPECAQRLVRRFEQAQQAGRAFALDGRRRLISPHEYAAAQRLAPQTAPDAAGRLTIAGGCFPVQHNIPPARLYHVTLRRLLAADTAEPAVEIIRYERLSTCLAKLEAAHARAPLQVLLFHLRAEPVMRLAKLYYRYRDDQGRVRHSLAWPWGPGSRAGHYDLPSRFAAAPAASAAIESPAQRWLRQLNLRLGKVLGHRRRALGQYEELVAAVAAFCRREGIRLLLIGPVSRPCAPEENQLSAELHAHFAAFAARQGLAYLPVLGETDAAGQPLFFPNGIYVSPAGHDRIAHKLYEWFRQSAGGPAAAQDVPLAAAVSLESQLVLAEELG